MRNYFNVIQRHIGSKAVYNYIASRHNRNGIHNTRNIMGRSYYIPRNSRKGMIKNTKVNHNWGKVPIGVHTLPL